MFDKSITHPSSSSKDPIPQTISTSQRVRCKYVRKVYTGSQRRTSREHKKLLFHNPKLPKIYLSDAIWQNVHQKANNKWFTQAEDKQLSTDSLDTSYRPEFKPTKSKLDAVSITAKLQEYFDEINAYKNNINNYLRVKTKRNKYAFRRLLGRSRNLESQIKELYTLVETNTILIYKLAAVMGANFQILNSIYPKKKRYLAETDERKEFYLMFRRLQDKTMSGTQHISQQLRTLPEVCPFRYSDRVGYVAG